MCWRSCTHGAEGFGLKLPPSPSKCSPLNMGYSLARLFIQSAFGGKERGWMDHMLCVQGQIVYLRNKFISESFVGISYFIYLFIATSAAHRSSQARVPTGAGAAGLRHSNAGWAAFATYATQQPDRYSTEWGQDQTCNLMAARWVCYPLSYNGNSHHLFQHIV